ncbi:DUF992 domain-containing protein [Tianweitania sp. Rool2]|uniref:DUF992 domain-containing protein n=2 Tax=Oryzicola mucosus TaxID=2767425 RepID=A0A8J6PWI4_9HYPH|nr:DUF992 domain-containing protein [Oryzicola mucosus]
MLMSSAASAQPMPQIGLLSCDVSEGIGLILERKQTLTCTFTQNGGQTESYTGSIDEFGIEIGTINQSHLVWGVAAATEGVAAKGALTGQYAGVGAEAAVGVGAGANVLVGGTGKAFSLQPISVEGSTGLNIATGVVQVTLTAAP